MARKSNLPKGYKSAGAHREMHMGRQTLVCKCGATRFEVALSPAGFFLMECDACNAQYGLSEIVRLLQSEAD